MEFFSETFSPSRCNRLTALPYWTPVALLLTTCSVCSRVFQRSENELLYAYSTHYIHEILARTWARSKGPLDCYVDTGHTKPQITIIKRLASIGLTRVQTIYYKAKFSLYRFLPYKPFKKDIIARLEGSVFGILLLNRLETCTPIWLTGNSPT